MKTCSKCGVEKPLTEFYQRQPERFHSACKFCSNAQALIKREFDRTNNPTPEQARDTVNKALAEKGQKRCLKCGVDKPTTDFTKVSRNKDGLRPTCRDCHNPYARILSERCNKRNPGRRRTVAYKSRLKLDYGLTPEDKVDLIADQKGCCAICLEPFSASFNTHVDHVHGSDPVIIRGILCNRCNFGLGHFKDSPERLLNAAAYLKKFPEKT